MGHPNSHPLPSIEVDRHETSIGFYNNCGSNQNHNHPLPRRRRRDRRRTPRESRNPYILVLKFIWTFLASPDKILPPTAAPLQDDETITWEKKTTAQSLEKNALVPRLEVATPAMSTDGAITAMTKLSESLVKNQEAALKASEEKADNRLKAWKKLPKIQQDIILLGGVDESGGVPDEPTEEMLSILGCPNGAQVEQFLTQAMRKITWLLNQVFVLPSTRASLRVGMKYPKILPLS